MKFPLLLNSNTSSLNITLLFYTIEQGSDGTGSNTCTCGRCKCASPGSYALRIDLQFRVHKFVKLVKGLSARLLRQEFPRGRILISSLLLEVRQWQS